MEGLTPQKTPDKIRSSKEAEFIASLADITRESAELKRFTLALSQEGDSERNDKLLSEIKRESDAMNILPPEKAERQLLQHEENYMSDAEVFRESAPSHSAYLVGYIAKLKQLSEKPFQPELEKSKRLTKQKNQQDIQLSDLLPHAQILGIARRQIEKEVPPPLEVLAKLALENKTLARDIGLVLDENHKEQFLLLI